MTDTPKSPKRGGWVQPPFRLLAPIYMLSEEEIAELRREAKETRTYYQKAFAHLRPKAGKDSGDAAAQSARAQG